MQLNVQWVGTSAIPLRRETHQIELQGAVGARLSRDHERALAVDEEWAGPIGVVVQSGLDRPQVAEQLGRLVGALLAGEAQLQQIGFDQCEHGLQVRAVERRLLSREQSLDAGANACRDVGDVAGETSLVCGKGSEPARQLLRIARSAAECDECEQRGRRDAIAPHDCTVTANASAPWRRDISSRYRRIESACRPAIASLFRRGARNQSASCRAVRHELIRKNVGWRGR